jgi:hypothetical protein
LPIWRASLRRARIFSPWRGEADVPHGAVGGFVVRGLRIEPGPIDEGVGRAATDAQIRNTE